MPDLDSPTAYQALFEFSSVGIIISNADGVIRRVNPHANRIFGYEKDELLGQKIEVLIPARYRSRHVEHRIHYNERPVPRTMGIGMTLTGIRKDHSEFPVEISLASYQIAGQRHIVSFINDITKRKHDEETLRTLSRELERKVETRTEELSQAIRELQQTNEQLGLEMEQRKKIEMEALHALEKEKELSELKSRFVSMASHEFRTPLGGVLTSVSLIERHNISGNPDKITKHVQTIRDSVHSLTNILNDFLSIDKLDEGRVECNLSTFDVDELIHDLTHDMQTMAKQNQQIVYKHDGSVKTIHSDRQILRNILINLISNAIKYSPEGAGIHLMTRSENEKFHISVKDWGIGIPEDDQKHLFERFFRGHNATTIHGTGLGLNIVRRYLDLIGGQIRYMSQENKGSIFTVMLPKSFDS